MLTGIVNGSCVEKSWGILTAVCKFTNMELFPLKQMHSIHQFSKGFVQAFHVIVQYLFFTTLCLTFVCNGVFILLGAQDRLCSIPE